MEAISFPSRRTWAFPSRTPNSTLTPGPFLGNQSSGGPLYSGRLVVLVDLGLPLERVDTVWKKLVSIPAPLFQFTRILNADWTPIRFGTRKVIWTQGLPASVKRDTQAPSPMPAAASPGMSCSSSSLFFLSLR